MHLDATVLAFSVILFLVILGHYVGSAIRVAVEVNASSSTLDEELIRRHRAPPAVIAAVCTAGVLTIVGVLFVSRGRIEGAANGRLLQAQQGLALSQDSLSAAQRRNDLPLMQQWDTERQRRLGDIPVLQDRQAYAQTIAALNGPIMALNLVLALSAALLGYLHESGTLEIERLRQRSAPSARGRLDATRAEVVALRESINNSIMELDNGDKAIRHLAQAGPLLSVEPKLLQLSAVVPSFRAENARARGLDPRNIAAFSAAVAPIRDGVLSGGFAVPESFADSLSVLEQLRKRFNELENARKVELESE